MEDYKSTFWKVLIQIRDFVHFFLSNLRNL